MESCLRDISRKVALTEFTNINEQPITLFGRIPQASWDGSFDEKNKPCGEGQIWLHNGQYCKGTFTHEYDDEIGEIVSKGEGVYKYVHEEVYEGSFLNGKNHGQGTCKWPDGSTYTGEWANNKQHGAGRKTEPSGNIYEGNFVEGLMKG